MTNTTRESFYGLGIAPGLLEITDKLGFTAPTPIQHKAIPIGIEGKDVIGIAQTGTGKTIAFGIPMIQQLSQKRGRGLVLVPTRELAIQVNEAIVQFASAFSMGTSVLIGGEPILEQVLSLRKNPRIIIATPGRLIDHISQQRIRLDDVNILVLDEADRMLDMGFAPQIERILQLVPMERQTMLFSATMPPQIMEIASKYMHLPVRTEIAPPGTAAASVSQEIFVVNHEHKIRLLGKILDQYTGPVLIFTRTKRGACQVTRQLRGMGHAAAETHADRSFDQRKEALAGFKSGRFRIMVATDIAARGLDVTGIELVINFDLPDDPENYVHRIGRTGRAGQEGHAITLATPDQGQDVRNIEKLIKTTIPLSDHPEIPIEKFEPIGAGGAGSHGHGHGHGHSGRDHSPHGRSSHGHSSHGHSGQSAGRPSNHHRGGRSRHRSR